MIDAKQNLFLTNSEKFYFYISMLRYFFLKNLAWQNRPTENVKFFDITQEKWPPNLSQNIFEFPLVSMP